MAFNKEDKINLAELSPSVKNLFTALTTQVSKEKEARIAADTEMRNSISKARIDIKKLIDNKYNAAKKLITDLETDADKFFDSDGKLVFPDGKKFWISDSLSDPSKYGSIDTGSGGGNSNQQISPDTIYLLTDDNIDSRNGEEEYTLNLNADRWIYPKGIKFCTYWVKGDRYTTDINMFDTADCDWRLYLNGEEIKRGWTTFDQLGDNGSSEIWIPHSTYKAGYIKVNTGDVLKIKIHSITFKGSLFFPGTIKNGFCINLLKSIPSS